jgi:hypothetical protein
MGKHLRNIGLVLIAAWAVLLLVLEYQGLERFDWMPTLLGAGIVLTAGGVILQILGRAGRAVRRTRCARCRRPVQPGEVYCPEHFHQALDRIKDSQERDS